MTKTPRQQAVEIAEQVMDALDAAKRGESHPRLINYRERGIAERLRRAQVLAESRALEPQREAVKPSTSNEPLGPVNEPIHHGPGGATRSD